MLLFPKTNLLALTLTLALMLVSSAVDVVDAQSFTCTMAAQDDEGCVSAVGDDQDHCAWCSVSGFGFCVSEQQAESLEQSIPGVECDRYSGDDDDDDEGTDDAVPAVDDDAAPEPVDDDAAPEPVDDDAAATDDGIAPPTDDAVPDDFWTCLQAKDEAACGKDAGCTWCMTKVGFGLCMAGPAAESASHSDWFTCATGNSTKHTSSSSTSSSSTSSTSTSTTPETTPEEQVQDPYDPACITAYLQDPTEAGCEAAADEDGNPCEWCNLAGMADVCLTAEQAANGAQLGITCDDQNSIHASTEATTAAAAAAIQDPLDFSCILAFLQAPTEEGCEAAVDQDGTPCEFCSYPGMGNLCLNADQADAGTAIGITCDVDTTQEEEDTEDTLGKASSPYDSACLMAYLQDASADGCAGALDQDGTACAYCSYPGIGFVCLASTQVDLIARTIGIECQVAPAPESTATTTFEMIQGSPSDTACIMAFLQDQSEEGCTTAMDADGAACEWCSYQGMANICLTEEQAGMAEQFGVTCDATSSDAAADVENIEDPSDTSCVMAFLQDQSEEGCTTAVDMDGAACEWCSYQGLGNICLTEEQAGMAEQLGVTCDNIDIAVNVEDPSDTSCVMAFLQDQSEEGCTTAVDMDGAACEWCSYQGLGNICLTEEQAGMAEQLGVTCDATSDTTAAAADNIEDPSDTSCVMAFLQDQSEEGCTTAVDMDGAACEWCSYQGLGNICLTEEQAGMAEQLGVTCDNTNAADTNQDEIVQDDPYGTACELAFSGDMSKGSCTSAVDEEGQPCQYCVMDGAMALCFNHGQSEVAEKLGFACSTAETAVAADSVEDPSDTSCVMAFLQDQSEEGCTTAVDMDGAACEWCSYQGLGNICLTEQQAGMAEQLGVTCDANFVDANEDEDEDEVVRDDPYGTACAVAFFGDMSKGTCTSTVDEEGQPCQYCVMDGAMTLCFNQQQSEVAERLGFACSTTEIQAAVDEDLYDKSCIMAFMDGEGTQDACTQAVDEDGAACKWCHVAGVADVCLTATQGDMATQLGVWCDGSDEIAAFKPTVKEQEEDKVEIPDDFFECLEHYQEGDCNKSSCTWCNSNVGMGFCMADAAARALKECDFFQCDYKKAAVVEPVKQVVDPYDPVCLTAGMQNQDDAEDVCNGTMDSDGSACVWCDAAGVFGICMSSEQASMAGQFLKCDVQSVKIA